MLISLNIQSEKEEDVQRIAKALLALGEVKVEVTPKQSKKAEQAPGQIEIKVETPAPAVETPAPVVETPAPVVETPAPVETLDYDSMREQIKALATQFVRENKASLGKEILAKVGAKKVSEVPDDKLEEILQAFKEA